MIRTCSLLAAFGLAVMTAPAQAQTAPVQIGSNGDWAAYTVDVSGGKVCYAQAVPRSIEPRNVNRDPIFFNITDWSARKIKGEPEVVPGYKYKEGSSVTAQIGSDKFVFFTRNDTTGGAWLETRGEEQRLIEAMQRGAQMIVTGTSTRGTLTRDTYSLAGFTASLNSIHKACNM